MEAILNLGILFILDKAFIINLFLNNGVRGTDSVLIDAQLTIRNTLYVRTFTFGGGFDCL